MSGKEIVTMENQMKKIEQKIVGFKVVQQSSFEANLIGKLCYVGNTQEELDKEITSRTIRTIDSSGYRVEEEGSVLDTKSWKFAKELISKEVDLTKAPKVKELKRPRRLDNTWRLKPPYAEHALYVTLTAIELNGKKYPFEIFFNNGKDDAKPMWTNALTLSWSELFRQAIQHDFSLKNFIKNLKETPCSEGCYRVFMKEGEKPVFIKSIVAEIGYIIEEFTKECLAWNCSNSTHEVKSTEKEKKTIDKRMEEITLAQELTSFSKEEVESLYEFEEAKVTNPCPTCCEQLILMDGCPTCVSCGFSKCG